MVNLFKITYWASFESDSHSKHHRIETFWFWRAPCYLSWVVKEIKDLEKNKKVVLSNCGKI